MKICIFLFFLYHGHSLAYKQGNVGNIEMGLKYKNRRPQNEPGNFFVDESCIDCDACRWIAPDTFSRVGLGSIVHQQPRTHEEKVQAVRAMLSCPVGSIRTMKGDPFVKKVASEFPFPIVASGESELAEVFHLGYHSKDSYGATPYLITPPSNNNIMIDIPRFNGALADKIEKMGGIKYLIVTHIDNTSNHQSWKRRFPNLIRIMHRFDTVPDTRNFECILEGEGPWNLSEDEADSLEEGKILYIPGHTLGSIAFLYERGKAIFTGDTVGYSSRRGRLDGWSLYNRGGIERQAKSMEKLSKENFLWMLSSRGKVIKFSDAEEREIELIKTAKIFLETGITFV